MFVNESYFDSYGCPPPVNVTSQIKRGISSECQIQKHDTLCTSVCLKVF